MLDPDFDVPDDDEHYSRTFDIQAQPIYRQWRTERWLMEILLWPAKAPRRHPVDKLAWITGNRSALNVVLATLERDGLIQRNGEIVSATKAAISFRRLELGREG